MSAHAPACRAVGVSFIPLAFEALGGMSEATTTSLSRIGRLLGQRLGVSPADSIRHLFQRCSVSLWRGNAALWLHRFPVFVCFVLRSLFLFFFFYCFFLSSLYLCKCHIKKSAPPADAPPCSRGLHEVTNFVVGRRSYLINVLCWYIQLLLKPAVALSNVPVSQQTISWQGACIAIVQEAF